MLVWVQIPVEVQQVTKSYFTYSERVTPNATR